MAAQTNRLVEISTVIVPAQVSKDFVKGVTTLVKRLAPPISKNIYMAMQFIPTILKKSDPSTNTFLMSINQYENAIANRVHPPLAKTNDEVAIFLIIGVILNQSRP